MERSVCICVVLFFLLGVDRKMKHAGNGKVFNINPSIAHIHNIARYHCDLFRFSYPLGSVYSSLDHHPLPFSPEPLSPAIPFISITSNENYYKYACENFYEWVLPIKFLFFTLRYSFLFIEAEKKFLVFHGSPCNMLY